MTGFQTSFFVKCAWKVEMGKKNLCEKSQENVILDVVGIPFARRMWIKQRKTVKVHAEDVPHDMKWTVFLLVVAIH